MKFLRRFFIRLSDFTAGRRAEQGLPLAENFLLESTSAPLKI